MNQTFQQILNNGYTFPTDIDEPTQELIKEWFQYRQVADNNKFIPWFNRSLNLNYPYYRQLLRIDPTVSDYDWLIENYKESLYNSEKTGKSNGSDLQTNKQDITGTSDINTSVNSETTGESNTKDNTQGFNRDSSLSRVAPMSQEYTVEEITARNSENISVGGETITGYATGFPNLNIQNPTTTGDTLNKNGTVSQNQNTESSMTKNTSVTSSSDNRTTTNNNTSSKQTEETESLQNTSIESGRNVNIAELLQKAKSFILSSKAWDFLYKELDKTFLQVYEESED